MVGLWSEFLVVVVVLVAFARGFVMVPMALVGLEVVMVILKLMLLSAAALLLVVVVVVVMASAFAGSDPSGDRGVIGGVVFVSSSGARYRNVCSWTTRFFCSSHISTYHDHFCDVVLGPYINKKEWGSGWDLHLMPLRLLAQTLQVLTELAVNAEAGHDFGQVLRGEAEQKLVAEHAAEANGHADSGRDDVDVKVRQRVENARLVPVVQVRSKPIQLVQWNVQRAWGKRRRSGWNGRGGVYHAFIYRGAARHQYVPNHTHN
jgi:hypothetical protein